MIYLKEISITNLFSFENVHFTFPNSAKLLTGINETDLGQSSNGSGKSSLTESLFLGLFGDSVREQSNLSDVVRDGNESGSVKLILTNRVSGEEVKIIRTFSTKKSSTCSLYIDDVEKRQATVNEYNNFIADYIGIDKNIIRKFFFISRDNYIPFMTLSDNQKKEYITSLINLEIFSDIDKKIKLEEKEIDKLYLLNDNTSLNIKNQLEKIKNDLTFSIENYLVKDILQLNQDKDNINEEILTLEQEQVEEITLDNSLSIFIENLKQEQQNLLYAIEEQNNVTNKFEKNKQLAIQDFNSRINHEKESILEINKSKSEYDNLITLTNNKITINQQRLEHSVTCPNCNHNFFIGDNKSKNDYELEQLEFNKDIKNFTELSLSKSKKLVKLNDNITKLENRRKESVKVFDQFLNEASDKLYNLKIEFSNKTQYLKDCENSLKKNREEWELNQNFLKIKQEKLDKLHTNLLFLQNSLEKLNKLKQDRIKEIEKEVEILSKSFEDKINEGKKIKNDLDNKVKLRLNFIQFKSYVVAQFLETINALVNYYLSKISDDFSLSIKDVSSNKKGVIQEKIAINIFRSGSEITYTKLSRGEKNRIDLSLILAFRNLYMEKSPVGGINFMTLDEILSDMDYQGIDAIMKTLNNLAIPSLIVTQLDPSQFVNNVITVIKQNGISNIYE